MKSDLSIFNFVVCTFISNLGIYCQIWGHKELMFGSLIYFDFIFIYRLRKRPNIILWHVVTQLFITICWKKLHFLNKIILAFCQNQLCVDTGFISGLSILSHWSICYCYPSITLFWLLLICSKSWNLKCVS